MLAERLTTLSPRLEPDAALEVTAIRSADRLPVRITDLPFFREQSYHALSRHDAAPRADLGTYRAYPAVGIQPGKPFRRVRVP